ncbi:hypothetical protein HHI36_019197 [Cryptolaemus montrouzieri]|uniref:BRICHOS domain-containing protein n=1 Tax=Cryptolaemus montrouzieri TaxID=559131 RepID=A0ABD2P264_9CUCU
MARIFPQYVFVIFCCLGLGSLEKTDNTVTKLEDDTGRKATTIYDYHTRMSAYKDLVASICYIEFIKNGETLLSQRIREFPMKKLPEELYISEEKLSKRRIWDLAGPRIWEFCRGFPTYLIQEVSNKNVNEDSAENNEITKSQTRRKRSTRHYFVGRLRGQTQSQYMNFGSSNNSSGKAEAESAYGGSRATVVGTNGMGQAQSQSSPFDCDDCYRPIKTSEYEPQPGSGYPFSEGRGDREETGNIVPGEITIGQPGSKVEPSKSGKPYLPGGGYPQRPSHSSGGSVGRPGESPPDLSVTSPESPSGQVIPGNNAHGSYPGGSKVYRPGEVYPGATDTSTGGGGVYPGVGDSSTATGTYPGGKGSSIDAGHAHPGGRESYPGASGGAYPGGKDTYPGGRHTYPGGGDTYPGGRETYPEGRHTYPGGGDTYPGGRETYPGGGDTYPGGRETYPGGRETYPGGRETYPGGIHTYPGGRDGYPAGIGGAYPGGRDTFIETGGRYPGGITDTSLGPGKIIPGNLGGTTAIKPGEIDTSNGNINQPHMGRQPDMSISGFPREPGNRGTQYIPDGASRGPIDSGLQYPQGVPGGQDKSYQPIPSVPIGPAKPGYQWPPSHVGTHYPVETTAYPAGVTQPGYPIDSRLTPGGTPTQLPRGYIPSTGRDHYNGRGHSGTFSGQFSGVFNLNGQTLPQGQNIHHAPSETHLGEGKDNYPNQMGGQRPETQYGRPRPDSRLPETGYPQKPEIGRPYPGQESIDQRVPSQPIGPPQLPGYDVPTKPSGGIGATQEPVNRVPYGYPKPSIHQGPIYGQPVGPGSNIGPQYSGGPYQTTGDGQFQPSHPGPYGIRQGKQEIPGEQLGGNRGSQYLPNYGSFQPGHVDQQFGVTSGQGIYPPGNEGQYQPVSSTGKVDHRPDVSSNQGVYQPGIIQGQYPSTTGQVSKMTPGGTEYGQGPYQPGTGERQPGQDKYQPGNVSGTYLPNGTRIDDQTKPGNLQHYFPTSGSGVSGQPAEVTGDDSDSQAQTSVQQINNETQASAQAQGKFEGGTAQSQVSGSYSGSGSFSASAGSDDGRRGALTQVTGGKQGALSSAQGHGGKGKSQAQMQLFSDTGKILSNAQSGGTSYSSQTQVQGGEEGGMANAQSNGSGHTSSQAQIGFSPQGKNDKEDKNQNNFFLGGGTANAQGGSIFGQSQSQIQGKFRYGIKYSGGAQAQSGYGNNRNFTFLPFNSSIQFKPLEPFPQFNTQNVLNTPINTDAQINAATNESVLNEKKISRNDPLEKTTGRSITNTKDEGEEEEYDYEESDTEETPMNRIITQTRDGQTQRILLPNMRNLDARVIQTHSDDFQERVFQPGEVFEPGQVLPGASGFRIPPGFRGKVKSVASPSETYALGKHSQAQSVTITPGTGRIIYNKGPKISNKNAYRSINSYEPYRNYFRSGENVIPNFLSISKSETGYNNPITGRRMSSTHYTQSTTCGLITGTCVTRNGQRICLPNISQNFNRSIRIC